MFELLSEMINLEKNHLEVHFYVKKCVLLLVNSSLQLKMIPPSPCLRDAMGAPDTAARCSGHIHINDVTMYVILSANGLTYKHF